MATEDAPVGMEFVDDDVPKILKQLRPAWMMRKDAGVDHVRIAEHDVRSAADRPAGVLRRVAVVGEHANLVTRCSGNLPTHRLQLRELILRERLGWEQVQRPSRMILKNGVENWGVVTERLP